MAYDAFSRGAAPVGVRSTELVDAARGGRRLALELWYPADLRHRGEDLADATRDRFTIAPGLPEAAQRAVRGAEPARGRFPLIAYFHGATGHRREATELCTHLASHGYLVAAPDFTGNTMADMFADLAGGGRGEPRLAPMDRSAADRPLDAKLVIDRMQGGADRKPAPGAGAQRAEGERSHDSGLGARPSSAVDLESGANTLAELAALVDPERVGACGISFGGWTTLALNSIDRRPRASFPIVPAWGKGPVKTETLQALVRLDDWGRPVPTFVLAAERDALILLAGLRELHRELRPPKRLAVLNNAGHLHFADNAEQGHEMLRAMWKSGSFPAAPDDIDLAAIAEASRPFSELCPAAHGAATVQALCLAHMDAHVKGSAEARAFLESGLPRAFAARGIDLELA